MAPRCPSPSQTLNLCLWLLPKIPKVTHLGDLFEINWRPNLEI